jgi:uncharacterized spore protein YtfJ
MTTEEQHLAEKDYIGEMFTRLEDLQANATVDMVFGQPVTTGDKIVIPVASVSYGFGFGFGEGTDRDDEKMDIGSGGGGAGGVNAKPLGLVEITPERTRVEPIVNEQTLAVAGMALVAWSVFWVTRAAVKILRP